MKSELLLSAWQTIIPNLRVYVKRTFNEYRLALIQAFVKPNYALVPALSYKQLKNLNGMENLYYFSQAYKAIHTFVFFLIYDVRRFSVDQLFVFEYI